MKNSIKESDNLQQHTMGHFGFSAAKIDDLGASEYTLVTIAVDRSGSTSGYQQDMEKCLKNIIEACQSSPRADNLLIRLIAFDSNHEEIHGFKLLSSCSQDDYDGILSPRGMTALFDASVDAIEASANYGKQLLQEDYDVNAICIIITDGMDNMSKCNAQHVGNALQTIIQDECVESLVSIFVSIGPDSQYIAHFNQEAGFTQYVPIGEATPKKLARLGEFVSQSISSQSSALNSGGPSQPLNF